MDENVNEIGNNRINCPKCGKTIDRSIRTCIYCGTSIETNQVSQKETAKDTFSSNNNEQTNTAVKSEIKDQSSVQPEIKTQSSTQLVIDPQQIEDRKSKEDIIFCPNCGKKNNKGNTFCVGCGTQLNNTKSVPSTDIEQHKNKKKANPGIVALLVVLSFVIYFMFPKSIGIILLLAIISLFNKETRSYGISILVVYGVMLITIVVFMIVMFGMCIAMLGG